MNHETAIRLLPEIDAAVEAANADLQSALRLHCHYTHPEVIEKVERLEKERARLKALKPYISH